MRKVWLALALVVVVAPPVLAQNDIKLVATSKTSTLEKEMNLAAEAGYRLAAVMGGQTAFGGSEAVVVMTRLDDARPSFGYRLLAANRTGTLQAELQNAADAGYEYKGQTSFKTAFGGHEVVLLLERDKSVDPVKYEYKLLATNKTSTMQKELAGAGAAGYQFVGMTVSQTMAGAEVVCILRRKSTT